MLVRASPWRKRGAEGGKAKRVVATCLGWPAGFKNTPAAGMPAICARVRAKALWVRTRALFAGFGPRPGAGSVQVGSSCLDHALCRRTRRVPGTAGVAVHVVARELANRVQPPLRPRGLVETKSPQSMVGDGAEASAADRSGSTVVNEILEDGEARPPRTHAPAQLACPAHGGSVTACRRRCSARTPPPAAPGRKCAPQRTLVRRGAAPQLQWSPHDMSAGSVLLSGATRRRALGARRRRSQAHPHAQEDVCP